MRLTITCSFIKNKYILIMHKCSLENFQVIKVFKKSEAKPFGKAIWIEDDHYIVLKETS